MKSASRVPQRAVALSASKDKTVRKRFIRDRNSVASFRVAGKPKRVGSPEEARELGFFSLLTRMSLLIRRKQPYCLALTGPFWAVNSRAAEIEPAKKNSEKYRVREFN